MRRQSLRTRRSQYVPHSPPTTCSLLTFWLSATFLILQSKIPFAVVGSNNEVRTADGRSVRGRAYPWGVIEVDNEDHCDFVKLRQMLVRTYMEELREHTNDVLYENYRSEKLLGMGVTQDTSVFKEIKYVLISLTYDLASPVVSL